MEKLIAKFGKNASEEVWVQLREFRGHQLLDIRVHFRADDGGEARPTKKGISVSIHLIPTLLDSIQGALQALGEAGVELKPPTREEPPSTASSG